jgi:alpha-galactosidase
MISKYANGYFLIALICLLTSFPLMAVTVEELAGDKLPDNAIWLESLDVSKISQEWGKPQIGLSYESTPMSMAGVTFKHGVGTFAYSEIVIDLKGSVKRFETAVGLPKMWNTGSVVFEIWLGNKKIADSGVVLEDQPAKVYSIDVTGHRWLILRANTTIDGHSSDNACWAGARFILSEGAVVKPEIVTCVDQETLPIAPSCMDKLQINSPLVIGFSPHRPFLFRIPATGKKPLRYSASNLPEGLVIDSNTGIISGLVKTASEKIVEFEAADAGQSVKRKVKFVCGHDKLALTPPMGWSSWNAWGAAVDENKIRQAVDAMIDSDLAGLGYKYINIDDVWAKGRDSNGRIQVIENKFTDMKVLGDYVHSKGLKYGIYSGPGDLTCGSCPGSYQHEQIDVQTWSDWGVDFLKYDYCFYWKITQARGLNVIIDRKPYELMGLLLKQANRDIVYEVCEYGFDNVWKWAPQLGGNLWRTGGDVLDNWANMSGIGFMSSELAEYVGPGHWNHPDMLVMGMTFGWDGKTRPTKLTKNEQITHMTVWAMAAAPLMLGCDLTQLDEFTLSLIGSDEVIAVDQDPLGKAGKCVVREGLKEVWVRPLWDGTYAVALFNRLPYGDEISVSFKQLGLKNKQSVRDIWQKKDLGKINKGLKKYVPAHGALLFKIGTPDELAKEKWYAE